MQDCCRTGFRWNGTPTGKVSKLGEHNAYVTGESKDRAILICHDAFGWAFNNTRLLADHFAREIGATVYLPDFFDNNAVPDNDVWITVTADNKAEVGISPSFDFLSWWEKNRPETRHPQALACARQLRAQYTTLGLIGYCWGGSAAFLLASAPEPNLFDAISVAHPGTPTEDQIRGIKVPFQLIAPEHDPQFPFEWSKFCNEVVPGLGVAYDWQWFPGMKHGFSTKCDEGDERERKGLERAKGAVVYWMRCFL